MSYSPDRCDHLGCGFENRLEYCEIEAADPDGGGQICADALDEFIERKDVATDGTHRYSSDKDGISSVRSFRYVEADADAKSGSATEVVMDIAFMADRSNRRRSYEVVISRLLSHPVDGRPTLLEGWLSQTYSIETYAEGDIQATACETDIVHDGQKVERPMNDYDFNRLVDELYLADRNMLSSSSNN